ncbi:LysR family transcriptional regulator [Fervidibacillus albus]|uniref:LysR family transcriptional regulator n=1 Tax=Fervidibacillus albus TaxID=2980026 RepID=A0A9E8RX59_9BACI|nr:LysR family transcriptional regulator [Fervidibacillus albus]WAA10949.1 LysR family transcriptional regulator [Fervidibacillus albus]
MDLRQLRYFLTIAKEGQITKAAKVLHMAQPPLSQSLKLLEEELGVVLFERNGRKMEMTKAGKILYTRMQSIFAELEETIAEVRDTELGVKGTLAIGCAKTCFSYLPERLKQFHETYPNVSFELREGDTYMLSEQLKNKEIDIAFVRLPLRMDSFSSIPLPDERYVAVVPGSWGDDWKNESISLEELARLPLMLLHRIQGFGQFEVILEAFRERGYEPNIICECPDVDMLLGLVSEGLGVSIVPESTFLKPFYRNVTILSISDATIMSKASIIWLKGRYLPQSARNFLSLFSSSFE